MNVQRGLQRINAAFWSLFGAVWVVVLAVGLFEGRGDAQLVVGALAMMGGCYVAYRVCRWIIAGFFDNA